MTRSVVVVFPASMWAMIPIFRVFSSCVVIATSSSSFPASRGSPAVMREGLVGLGHLVRVFLLLDRHPPVVVGIQDFPRQTVDHRFFGALLREVDHPPERKSEAPLGADLDRDLIGRSSHPAGFDLDDGLGVFHGFFEDAYRIFLRLLLDDLHRTVDDFLRDGFLPLAHDPVDHPRNERIAVDRIRPYDPSGHKPSSGHQESLLTVPASSLNKQVATTHGRAPRGAWRPSVTLPPVPAEMPGKAGTASCRSGKAIWVVLLRTSTATSVCPGHQRNPAFLV